MANDTASSLGFAVVHQGDDPTNEQLMVAVMNRLIDLAGDEWSEIGNALWDGSDDSFECDDADVTDTDMLAAARRLLAAVTYHHTLRQLEALAQEDQG